MQVLINDAMQQFIASSILALLIFILVILKELDS